MALRYLLDSDICIYLLTKRVPRVLGKFDAHAPESALSIVSYGELCYGVAKSLFRTETQQHVNTLLAAVTVLSLPLQAGERYGEIRARLEGAGRPISGNDLWIAAHALASDLVLVTNNEREFRRVPDLRVENWSAQA